MEIRKVVQGSGFQFAVFMALGIGLRLLPHAPNFTAVGAIALLGGAVLSRKLALLLPVAIMAISDAVIGFYPGMLYTWLGFVGVAGFGMIFRNASFLNKTLTGSIGGSAIFFVVSNFGVWIAGGMYQPTIEGLIRCYVMAIPFYGATLSSGVVFGAVLFGMHSLIRVPRVRIEKAMSTFLPMVKYTHVENK